LTAAPRKIQNWLGRLSPAWRISLLAFLAGRLLFSAWAAVIWKMGLMPTNQGFYYFEITPILQGWPGALLGMWQRWDSIHYERILRFGYLNADLTAFFPLYPFLSRLLAYIPGLSPLAALLIVSNLAFLGSIYLLYRLASDLFGENLARRTLFILIIYPSTFFFYAAYPQSLLFFLILLAYTFARAGKWWAVAAAGFCAGLTHLTAVGLPALLVLPAFTAGQHKPLKERLPILFASLASLAGIGAYFLWRELAGYGSYGQLQSQVFQRSLHLPWDGVAAMIRYALNLPFTLETLIPWIMLLVFLVVVGITIWSVRKLPPPFVLFEFGLLLLILTTYQDPYPVLGVLRFPMILFPLYIGLASVGKGKAWRLAIFIFFVLTSLVCSAFFFMWKGGML